MKRLLIVGVGSIGERHLRCAGRLGCTDLAICEVNADLRNDIARRYAVSHAFADLNAALATQPTAAVICVPAHLHVSIARQLVAANVHLLIEKPLSTSLDGIAELQQATTERNLVVAVAYVHRANPILTSMREALHSGRFGRPVQLISVTGQNFPFYRPAYRNTYYRDRSTGGGAIQDALTHMLNAGEWLVGPIDRVQADAAHCLLPDVQVEDTVHVLARHGEVLASYSLNQHQAPNELSITVVCERGTLRFELHESRWRWMTEPGNEWHDEPFPRGERDDLFMAQLSAFFSAIEGGHRPLCTLEEGLQTLRVNLGILRSLEAAAWTKV
ncbi:MAG: Gfo/Idh/MocA family oxidoreductase [Pirellulales bacterium]|nr:Gfo/Idh/MocA family oxidoreductase [Pirellulales bacterium]